jgi:DNA-binding beta-propeller fold protein YncE
MKPGFLLTLTFSAALATPVFAADANYKVTDKFAMPNGGWDYATSDAAKGLIYWVRSDHTDVIDTKTQKLSSLKSTGDGHMAVVVAGTTLIVVPLRNPVKTSRIVDTATDSVVADLPSGDGPDGAAYDPFSKHVFVVNHAGSDVTEIDPIAKKVVATIPVGGSKLEFPASDGLGHMFVNVQQKGEIAVIDVKTSKVTATYKMAGCDDNSGLAYAAKSKVLISSCGNGTARVLMADAGKEVASIPIGEGPDAVIYDPLHEVVFIPCGESGKLEILSVADPAHITKLQELDTPPMARTGAIDPQGRLYMMAAEPDTTKPRGGGNRLPPKDGTFQMVVISQ